MAKASDKPPLSSPALAKETNKNQLEILKRLADKLVRKFNEQLKKLQNELNELTVEKIFPMKYGYDCNTSANNTCYYYNTESNAKSGCGCIGYDVVNGKRIEGVINDELYRNKYSPNYSWSDTHILGCDTAGFNRPKCYANDNAKLYITTLRNSKQTEIDNLISKISIPFVPPYQNSLQINCCDNIMSITASNVDESKLTQINNCINEANKILPPNSTPIPTIDKGVLDNKKTVNDTSNNKNKYIIIGIIICVLIFMSISSIGIVIV